MIHFVCCREARPGPMAPKRKAATTLDADQGKTWFCRMQTCEADIPIIPVDVLGGENHLMRVLKVLKRREKEISPFDIQVGAYSAHVTPLPIPNHLSSHHILRLYSGRTPFVMVDLLI